jgi:hypothetical protein
LSGIVSTIVGVIIWNEITENQEDDKDGKIY